MDENITSKIFTLLKTLILERLDINSFKFVSSTPDWFRGFFHQQVTSDAEILSPKKIFPFL